MNAIATDEPLDLIARLIGFDAKFYRRQAKIAASVDPLLHFHQTGRFLNYRVRPFDQDELRVAVNFDPGTYLSLHPDIAKASVDPWQHFINHGLREQRRTIGSLDHETEAAIWKSLGLDQTLAYAFTPADKYIALDLLDRSSIRNKLPQFLNLLGQPLYRRDAALVLAKLSLLVEWPLVAEAFLSSYREGLPFRLPAPLTPEVVHIYTVKSLSQYCESKGIPYHIVRARVEEGASPTNQFEPVSVCRLPGATILGNNGSILTADNVFISPGTWDQYDEPRRGELNGPRHRAATVRRSTRRFSKTALSLVQRDNCTVLDFLALTLPTILFATRTIEEGAPAATTTLDRLTSNVQSLHKRQIVPMLVVTDGTAPIGAYLDAVSTVLNQRLERTFLKRDEDLCCRTLICVGDPHAASQTDTDAPLRLALCSDTFQQAKALLAGHDVALGKLAATFADPAPLNGQQVTATLAALGFEQIASHTWANGSCANRDRPIFVTSSAQQAAMVLLAQSADFLIVGASARNVGALTALASAAEGRIAYLPGYPVRVADPMEKAGMFIDCVALRQLVSEMLTRPEPDQLLCSRMKSLAKTVAEQLDEPATAFELLHNEGRQLVAMTESSGQFAWSRELDAQCLALGHRILSSPFAGAPSRHGIRTYYASALAMIGGHTRLIQDCISARPEDEHYVLCGGFVDVSDGQEAAAAFASSTGAHLRMLPADPTLRLEALFALLRDLQPQTFFHFAHPDDPVGTAVLQPPIAALTVMVHHNDHSFAYGRTVPDVRHVAIHDRSLHQLSAIASTNSFMLPMTSKASSGPISWDDNQYELLTVTSGSGNKFSTRGNQRYIGLLRCRFAAREGMHVHIGPMPPAFKAAIEQELESYRDRLLHIAFSPDLPETLFALRPHLYLNSFPVGGGHALIDAMAVGLPIISAQYDPALDSAHLGYPEQMVWRHLSELRELFSNFSISVRDQHQAYSLRHFQRRHAPAVFRTALNEIIGEH